jgi:class 3 adenylate cyclase
VRVLAEHVPVTRCSPTLASAPENVDRDDHDRRVRAAVEDAGGLVVKTTGDGVFARFDAAGECEVRGDDLAGMTVHVGARVTALAAAGEVLVTGTVRDLVIGSDLVFAERGRHVLRGVPGEWTVLAVR